MSGESGGVWQHARVSGASGESVGPLDYARFARATARLGTVQAHLRHSSGTVWKQFEQHWEQFGTSEGAVPNLLPTFRQFGTSQGPYLIFCLLFATQLGSDLGPIWGQSVTTC